MHGALDVAQDDRPQVDRLDDPFGPIDRRRVSDPHLVLENQEEPADDVAHERLGAEADRETGDPGAGQDAGVMSRPNSRQHHQQRDTDHQHGDRVLNHGAERARAFRPLDRVQVGPDAHLVLETADEQGRHPHQRVARGGR